MDHVPYVTPSGVVAYGALVSALTLSGDVTQPPDTHVVFFQGEYPHGADGRPIDGIRHGSGPKKLGQDFAAEHSFSSKPPGGYVDHYAKMTTYVRILQAPAQHLDPSATAQTHALISSDEGGVFGYADTNSSRANIVALAEKVAGETIAIIGLGGTGSYVLDLVAKTPVAGVHLIDGDQFLQHNAFRSPGAPTVDELRATPMKCVHFREVYGRMHCNIVAHPTYLTSENLAILDPATFVFLCVDDGPTRRLVSEYLQGRDVPFLDTGMGVDHGEDALHGIVRVTASFPGARDKFAERVSFGERMDDAYATNVQVADLNMLNAAHAVLRWKKYRGFYGDYVGETHTTYTIDTGLLLGEGPECA